MNGYELLAKLRASDEHGLGRFAETVWENIFRTSGVRFIPLSKLDMGGAPRVDGIGPKIIVPDYDCAGDDWNAYIDSKCKNGPVLFRKLSQWRHGIDRRCWQAYKKTGEIFRKKAGLAIVELWQDFHDRSRWSGSLLVQSFKELGEPYDGESHQDHMVYWKRKAFVDLDSLSLDELGCAFRGNPPRTYELELRNTFAPQVQVRLF